MCHLLLRLMTAVALMVGLTLIGCREGREPSSPQVYEFGVAAPFTGQEGASVYGENIKRAVDLAIAEVNAAGGVRGRMLNAIYEDTQLQASIAVSAVHKLVDLHDVGVIIGPVASSSTIATSEIAQESDVILISPASTSHEISGISPFVFRTIAPDTLEGQAMAGFAKSNGYQRLAVAFVDNAGTRGPAVVFRDAIQRAGAEVVAFEVVPQGSTDARTQMTKLISGQPDAVYLLGYALELGSMIKQFREQDESTPILSFQVMEEPKVREIVGEAAEGVVFTSPTIYGAFATGTQRQFIDTFRDKYGSEPGIFAANAYDAVMVLAAVIEEHGFAVTAIRTALPTVRSFDGASGVFDIDSQGDSNQVPRFMCIKDGATQLFE